MDKTIYVKKVHEDAIIPTKGSEGAAGYDLYAVQDSIVSRGTTKVGTGIAVSIPKHCYGRIAPRSSLGIKGLIVHGGVIDSDYRGEIVVLLQSTQTDYYSIKKGDRIAQLIIEKYESNAIICETDELNDTTRGQGGFGSTGK